MDQLTQALQSTTHASNYYNWVAGLVTPHLGPEPLEMGSGLGVHASLWLQEPSIKQLTLTESSPERLELLHQSFSNSPRIDVMSWGQAMRSERKWSSLVAINVIEHVREDVTTLRTAIRRISPGGKIVLFAPAFPLLMSAWDRQIGHYRRYRLSTMGTLADRCDLSIETLRYINLPGFFAWLFGMRLLSMSTGAGEGRFSQVWDRLVIPPTRRLESHSRAPFGQSVLLVATTPFDPVSSM